MAATEKAAQKHAKKAARIAKSQAYILQSKSDPGVYSQCLIRDYDNYRDKYAIIGKIDQWGHEKKRGKNEA